MELIKTVITDETPLVLELRKLYRSLGVFVAGGAARRVAQGTETLGKGDFDIFLKEVKPTPILWALRKLYDPGAITRINDVDVARIPHNHLDVIGMEKAFPAHALTPHVNSVMENEPRLGKILDSIRTTKIMTVVCAEKQFHFVENDAFTTMDGVLRSFDFTVCQFITNGWVLYAPEKALSDLKAKRLHVIEGRKARSNSALRVNKYIGYGFEPEPAVLSWAISDHNVVQEDFAVAYV